MNVAIDDLKLVFGGLASFDIDDAHTRDLHGMIRLRQPRIGRQRVLAQNLARQLVRDT